MTIHIRKLPTYALYAAHADEFGLTAFGSCRDEALNNLQDALRDRQATPPPRKGIGDEPARQGLEPEAMAGGRKSHAAV